MSEYPGDSWSRLMAWIRLGRDDARNQVMAGLCSLEDYRGLCERARAFEDVLAQAKLVASGQDIMERLTPSPLRDVE